MTSSADERVERTRAVVRRKLGSALAEKASDELCVMLTARSIAPLRPLFAFEQQPLTAVAPAARHAAIVRLRTGFERTSAAVVETLRRARPRGPIRSSWLAGTVQAPVDLLLLAELAEEPALRRIDVAHRVSLHVGSPPKDVVLQAAAGIRHRLGLSGAGVAVGVIDTAVVSNHGALPRVIQVGGPFGTPADEHGTWVAGIIAGDGALLPASFGDARKFVGVAPGATIRSYRFPRGDTFDMRAAMAIEQAVQDDLRIVNCSWGVDRVALDGQSLVTRACDAAWRLGTAVIKSVGTRQRVTAPSDANGVITVGATTLDGTAMAADHPHGIHGGRSRPDLVAPGDGDPAPWSTWPNGSIAKARGGTSIAAPHVTGLLALLLEQERELGPNELRTRLLAACVPLAGEPASQQGRGIVSPDLLLEA